MVEIRGFLNVWGRSIGQLNQKVEDVKLTIDENVKPLQLEIEIDQSTTKIRQIPGDSEIRLSIRKRLRIHHYECGTKDEPQTPTDIETGENTVTKFGDDYRDAKWAIRFVDPREPGRIHAWTEGKRLVEKESTLVGGDGSSLIDIEVDQSGKLSSEAWSMNFEDENPTIMINPANVDLKDKFKEMGMTSYLIIPEVFGRIMDEIISEHIIEAISPGSSRWQERILQWSYDEVGIEQLPSLIDDLDAAAELNAWKKRAISKIQEKITQSKEMAKAINGDEIDEN